MILRNIRSNFYKILSGYGFYVCIVFTALLCFSANIYEDAGSGNKYSSISSLVNFDREFMLRNTSFCSFNVMCKGSGSWLSMFIPIISAFSFVPIACDEHEAKSIRFEVFRSSKMCYSASRFVTACFSGGLAVMLGFGLFVLLEYTLFPNITEYSDSSRAVFEEMLCYKYPGFTEQGYIPIFAEKLGCMFMYGAVCVAPTIMITSVVHNKYLVLCIPFFAKYAVNQTCVKLQSQTFGDYENFDTSFSRIISIINPDALSYLSQYGEDKKYVLIYSGIIIALSIIIYLIMCSGRVDCGE